jgi:putative glutamine transport system substrate-binding protein
MRSLFLLLVTSGAWAGQLETIRARGKLIVSVKNDANRPHKDPAHQEKRGFELDLTRALAKKLVGDESKVELKLISRPSRLPMLGMGNVDLVISMIPINAENQRQYDLSHPYFESGLALLVTKGSPTNGIDGLKDTMVAVLQQGFNNYGTEIERAAQKRNLKLKTRYYPSFDDAAQAVARGEASAMVSNFVDLSAYAKTHPEYRIVFLEPRLHAVAVKKGEATLLRAVDETIDSLKRSGELKRMTEKHQLPYLLETSH